MPHKEAEARGRKTAGEHDEAARADLLYLIDKAEGAGANIAQWDKLFDESGDEALSADRGALLNNKSHRWRLTAK